MIQSLLFISHKNIKFIVHIYVIKPVEKASFKFLNRVFEHCYQESVTLLYKTFLVARNPGGGALQLHFYGGGGGGVWPQDWLKNRPILRLFAIEIDQTTVGFIQFRGKPPIPR